MSIKDSTLLIPEGRERPPTQSIMAELIKANNELNQVFFFLIRVSVLPPPKTELRGQHWM